MRAIFLRSACLAAVACALHATPLRFGRAAVKITPETGPGKRAEAVHDDLYAKALVFEQDGTRAAMVVCDLAVVRAEWVENARAQILRETGIDPKNVIVSATHTHTAFVPGELGPVIPDGIGPEETRAYLDRLAANVATAVRDAVKDLQPVRIRATVGREESLIFNRRFLMQDGSARMNPGLLNPEVIRPLGPLDPSVNVVRFDSMDGKPRAMLVNYALHLDTTGGKRVSADYPYELARILGNVFGPDMLTVFSIGTAGNINHIDVRSPGPQSGYGNAASIGIVLAGAVLKALRHLEEIETTRLQVKHHFVRMTVPSIGPGDAEKARMLKARLGGPNAPTFLEQMWLQRVLATDERGGKPLDVEVQTITVGNDLAWVGLPGEIFVELGMALKQASPYRYTIIHELTNDWIRYVPNRKGHAEGAYEAINTRGAPGSGELLVDTATRMLVESRYARETGVTAPQLKQ